MNRFLRIVWEPDDIGEMGTDPVISAEPDNVVVRIGPILLFVGCDQCFPIKGLDAYEHLVAAGSSKQLHQTLLPSNLCVALNEELDL